MPDIVSSSLRSLPLYWLISAPLTAAINGQAKAAMSSAAFIQSVGFNDSNEAVTVDFKYKKTADDGTDSEVQLTVPLLTIINVPFIRIQEMTIDFEFNIQKTVTRDRTTTKTAQLDYSTGFNALFAESELEIQATYSNTSNYSSSLDKSATLKINVRAGQDEIPTGLATMLSLLSESVKESSA